jgi:hypothetical protein
MGKSKKIKTRLKHKNHQNRIKHKKILENNIEVIKKLKSEK